MLHTPNQVTPSRAVLADSLGHIGVHLYAFTAWLSPPLHVTGLALCFFALLLEPSALRGIMQTRAFAIWGGVTLYLLFQSLWGNHLFPNSLDEQLKETWRWLGCGNFLIIGWWLKGEPRIIRNTLTLGLAGLCVGVLHSVDLSALLSFQTGKQTGFHLTASTAALLAATALLGLLLTPPTPSLRLRHVLKLSTWCATMYLMLYLLVTSQSRATWIAALIAIPVTLRVRERRGSKTQGSQRLPGLGWGILLVMLLGIGLNRQIILDRIMPDLAVVQSLSASRSVDTETPSSFGYRLKVQQFGLQRWSEHPLIGWGTSSTRRLIAESGRSDLWHEPTQEWLRHVHNGYLEILIRFGLLGAGIFLFSVVSLFRGFLSDGAWQQLQPGNLSWLFAGTLLMSVIWTGGAFQMTNPGWQAYWAFILASGFSVSLFPTRPTLNAGKPSTVLPAHNHPLPNP